MTTRVSILVAAYNAEFYVAETIQSVLDQTFADWELVICDDGSTDATATIVQSFIDRDPRIKLVHQANSGGAAARNTAFSISRGEYIVLLDADDRILPEKLAIQVALLDMNSDVGVVYGDTWFCDQNGKRTHLESEQYPLQHKQGDVFYPLCCGNMMAVHSAMVRRAAINKVGGVHHPTKIQIADWDLWVRLAEKYPFIYHADPVADYRLHPMMSARQDNARKQVLQREFNVSRMEKLPRFAELTPKEKAQVYFATGRFCAGWKEPSHALKHYIRSWLHNPLYFKNYLAVFALLVGK
ncbi:glycosyltransferase family 2 protein [Pelotalea chapellei]|uniref:Glycosyltransferase n=1 Tax=Pelotalea chapellei TaxID=44671 RepID=A0ABS5U4L2_9BACT|nr:glycosyltransferase [Pelotalea chapellei]MBT1070608.1 glycosyltransferase [Pelotalea chapellei]